MLYPLLKKPYVLINFIENSFGLLRAIGKVHVMKNINWAHFVSKSKKS